MGTKTVIYDFGANNGDNIAYYLEKADRVVAVEANPVLCRMIEDRFAAEIAAGRLIVENVAVVAEHGRETTPFFIHRENHVLSQLPPPPAVSRAEFTEVMLPARHVLDIVDRHGHPLYIKIDIERSDVVILHALFAHGIMPDYISAEAHEPEVFCMLVALGGYRAFKLVDGATVKDVFAQHAITTRSGPAIRSFPGHSAGPFGNDIPGPWLDTKTFFGLLGRVGLGWKDIHASRVDAPGSVAAPEARPHAARAPHVAAMPRSNAPRHGFLRGDYRVAIDPLVFLQASGEPVIEPGIDRGARCFSREQIGEQAALALRRPEVVHDEPALILCCTWDDAFYHFLYDALGKLAVAELHGITPAHHAVYFNAVHPWQHDALRLLGVIPRPLAGGVLHRFRHAVIPSYPSMPWGKPTPESLRFIRRLRDPNADTRPGSRLFVTRGRGAATRRLENEAEIFARCFEPRGFTSVDPGALPFAEQCRLFSRATHIAGPHGAAFSLLSLGRLPLSVIELHSPHYYVSCFQTAASVLGARHAGFNARRDGFLDSPHRHADFSLDPGAVHDWLARLPAVMT